MTGLVRVSGLLDALGIPHALIGAAALAAYGVARSTYDIDLLTADARVLAADLWRPLTDSGAEVAIRRGDDQDPLGGVVRVESAGERPVDIVLGKHGWHARAVTRAQPLDGGPRVVQPRDLILLKLYAGGVQDLWDIRELLRAVGTAALEADVAQDLQTLPRDMQDRWRQRG